ncbi:MAG: FGGY family carbohydrate kinase [Lentisphaeria bacterium]
MGIDLGTSVCKAAAFSEDGRCLALAAREYPAPPATAAGLAELDSQAVWRCTREVIAEVAAATRHDPVTALCAGSMGEAMVPVSRHLKLQGNSILCSDARGSEHVAALERDFGQAAFYRINPNLLGPNYSLPKLLWLREHEPERFARADKFLLWGDLVPCLLGAEPFTSNSLANRTLLFDLERNDWSDTLLAWSGLDRRRFGPVVPGGTRVGTVSAAAAAELGLPPGVALVAGGHDQCCNALGCGAIAAGTAVCGIGTYECITPVFARPADSARLLAARLNQEHHLLPDLYVAFLYNQAGALVKWFRDTFCAGEKTAGADLYARLNAELPAAPTRLLVLPHFEAPQWPRHLPDSAGAILGLHTTTTRGEILKAVMEGATLYFADSLAALHEVGAGLTGLVASGGGAKSDAWLQIKADIFGLPVVRPRTVDAGLAGGAMLAGLATGVFRSPAEAARAFVHPERTFDPDPGRHAVYQEKLAQFRQLYPATKNLFKGL